MDTVSCNPRVLLVDKNQVASRTMVRDIEEFGMPVAHTPLASVAMTLRPTFKPEVVLLDPKLPDLNGHDLIGWFAKTPGCGVIVLGNTSDPADRIAALELGADDYIANPPNVRELVARIRAVHRRVSHRAPEKPRPESREISVVGPIRIDVPLRTVTNANGTRIALTFAEFTILEVLADAAGQVVSRDTLSERALRRPWQSDDRSIDQLVFSLRQKLPADANGRLIHTMRSAGYLLRAAGGPGSTPVEGSPAASMRRPGRSAAPPQS